MDNPISTGIGMILEGLNRRFGQLDVESSITTIIELLTFRWNHWESIDEALTRFELLRSRTDANAAGFQIPEAVLAWQMLVALNIPRTVWPPVFQSFGGRLATTEDQFQDMCTAIRQQGHIAEHTHAGPRDLNEGMNSHRRHFFGQNDDGDSHEWDEQGPWGAATYLGTSNPGNAQQDVYDDYYEAYAVYDDDGCTSCTMCESYLHYDEVNPDNDTETEDEQDTTQATDTEWNAYFGGDFDPKQETHAGLYEQLLFAKRRFRHGKEGKGKGSTPRPLTNNERQSQQETILQVVFAQDHWFLDKTSLFQTNSEDEHWDHHAVGATINLQTHASDVTKHFGSSVHIYELDNDNEWSKRMRTAAVRAGRPDTTSIPMRNQLVVGGVGTGTQTATQKVVHRIGLAGGREANYKTPVLPNSGTPALLGQRSLRKMRALIDCFTGRLYFIGPEDYQIKVSPGSETHELVESHAGHLMLPCSEFQDNSKATKEAMQVMNAHITKDGGAPPVSTNAGGVPKPRP